MITKRTKIQLVAFVIITLIGVSYVGARYARLDRLIRDDSYTVTAHFTESGGIFAGGEVTYRGVRVGQVTSLDLTEEGVDVELEIENKWDKIPDDLLAVVGNRSAVGEQYVELQPRSDAGPFLDGGSEIKAVDTRTPIATEKLLTDVSNTVASVDRDSLRTTVTEFSDAFSGAGNDLQTIIDTGNSFLQTADANFDVTTALIRDANTVLTGQVASESAIRNFSSQLALFSTTLAGADGDLRTVIDSGSFTANQLRTFLEQNRVPLGELIQRLVTTGEVVVQHLDGIEQALVIYPYVAEGSFTVASKSASGHFDAHFGLVLTSSVPCYEGYTPESDQRVPQDTEDTDKPTNTNARCAEPASKSNARGAQNAPRRVAPGYDAPVIADYDPATQQVTWRDAPGSTLDSAGTVAPESLREESWKWLYVQPLTLQ